MPMPVAKNAPAVPVAKAWPIERAIDDGDGWGATPNRVMNPSCNEWIATAMRKANGAGAGDGAVARARRPAR